MRWKAVDLATIEAIRDSYTGPARRFATWCRDGGHAFCLDAVREYVRELNGSNYSASTIGVHRAAIKRRIRQVVAPRMTLRKRADLDQALRELDSDVSTRGPRVVTAPVGVSKTVSEDEYRALLEGTTERQGGAVQFLWATGCRCAEMCGVRLDNCVDTGTGSVEVRVMGKGRKERIVQLPGELYDALRATYSGREFLFETLAGRPYKPGCVGKMICKVGHRILGRRISPCKFRHSFATEMIRKTGKIEAVSRYLGHSSVACTLQTYVHEQLDDSELFGEESQ